MKGWVLFAVIVHLVLTILTMLLVRWHWRHRGLGRDDYGAMLFGQLWPVALPLTIWAICKPLQGREGSSDGR